MADENKTTTIEEGTAFDGAVQSLGPVRVSGDLQGKLEAPSVVVTDSGAVRGEIHVGTIESTGELGGRVEADVVRLAGRVKDDTVIQAKTLVVDGNASGEALPVAFGTCELRIGKAKGSGGGSKRGGRETVVESQVEQRDATPPALEKEPAL